MSISSCDEIENIIETYYSLYIIDEEHLTYRDAETSKVYIDTQAIDSIDAGTTLFLIKATEDLYIKSSEELSLKSGWILKGKRGNEVVIKEKAINTSAIRIEDADQIQIHNFHLRANEFIPTEGKGLIEINSEFTFDKGIKISNLKLENHYSALWIKKGKNILIDNCVIADNAHQIYLGFLPDDVMNISEYGVESVTIQHSEIRDSKGGNVDGIKALSNCRDVRILNNIISANNQDGIDLYPGGVHVLIEGNTIRDNKVHGIEVKMTDDYLPSQTGQIMNVQIVNNEIINNQHDGIACLHKSDHYYPQGIKIINNRIDSSGIYGIRTELPILIEKNRLYRNGWLQNMNRPTVGYTGIFLLNICFKDSNLLATCAEDSSIVINNEIIDQAPREDLQAVYWFTANNVTPLTSIQSNKFFITDTLANNGLQKFGICILSSGLSFEEIEIAQQNSFSSGFTREVSVQN